MWEKLLKRWGGLSVDEKQTLIISAPALQSFVDRNTCMFASFSCDSDADFLSRAVLSFS